jgi:hypothetical protein
LGVARWQENEDVAIYSVTFQVALKRGTVNLDVLHFDRFRARHYRRNVCLNLSGKCRHQKPA